jgi:hypothetical protein
MQTIKGVTAAIEQDRARYVPLRAIRIRFKTLPFEVFLYEHEATHKHYNSARYVACGFYGKSSKPSFHHRYPSIQAREAGVKKYVKSYQETEAARQSRKIKPVESHPFMVGTILNGSWGYEQTNQEFYQVVELIGKNSIKIREIAQTITRATGDMSEYVSCLPNSFKGEPMTKRVQSYDGQSFFVRMESYLRLTSWDGEEKYQSHYA